MTPAAPNTDYTADPEQLRAHARQVDARAQQLSTIGVGLPSEMSGNALGMLAGFITTAISGAMAQTMAAFDHTAATLQQVGDGVRRAADTYEFGEESHTSDVAGIGQTLGEVEV